MKKWLIKMLGGVPKEDITLVGLLQASPIEDVNRALSEVYHSHVYRHRPRKSFVTKGEC